MTKSKYPHFYFNHKQKGKKVFSMCNEGCGKEKIIKINHKQSYNIRQSKHIVKLSLTTLATTKCHHIIMSFNPTLDWKYKQELHLYYSVAIERFHQFVPCKCPRVQVHA